jgi:hypothetical protein
MARNLDERFLTIHPRTALWMAQREKCLSCANLRFEKPSMNCAATPSALKGKALKNSPLASCIDAREPGAACGPDSKLFSPVVAGDPA